MNWGSDYHYCSLEQYVQAPIDITNIGANDTATFQYYIAYEWYENGFSFLPTFEAGVATWIGVEQYVYQVYGNFGGIYLAEPAVNNVTNHIVYYEASNIRFHYPSEHTLNGTQYDMEMQIFGNDIYDRALACYSHQAAVSILFKLDATSAAHPFFAWQATSASGDTTIDLTTYLTKVSGTTQSVSGYMGTDSMPGCNYGTCWYIMN